MPGAGWQLRDQGLTLEDYLAHKHALRTLQRAQPVWIVDDLLGLRYHARLQLCLTPTRHLLLTNDSSQSDDEHAEGADGGPPPSSSSSLVIPLTPECSIDVCASPTNGGESVLRITLTSSQSLGVEWASEGAPNAEAACFIVPITPSPGMAASLTRVWAAVLRSLCQPRRRIESTVAAPPPTAQHTPSFMERHADPHALSSASMSVDAVGVNGRSSTTPEPAIKDADVPSAPALPPAALVREAAHASLSTRTTPTTTTTTAATSFASNLSQTILNTASSSLKPTSIVYPNGPLKAAHNGDGHLDSGLELPPAGRARNPEEPPPLHQIFSPSAASIDDDDDRRLFQLTAALRNRTREAAQLAVALRGSISRSHASPPGSAHTGPDAVVSPPVWAHDTTTVEAVDADADVVEMDPERPPTMAHTSIGLVPALRGFQQLPPLISSDDEEEEADDDSGEGQDANISGVSVMDAQGGAHTFNRSRHTGSYSNMADSPRPQAPRSGRVCNLGSIGPLCGDEEALRMYNEIHGSHSSCSSRSAASTKTDGSMLSFRSSAYGSEGGNAGLSGGPGTANPALHGRALSRHQ
ncbi:hypothetical protein ABL78_6518 [Leptomonas seymouri]|uniref:Uncharacterized protein n=1 Tax=Leptomonas seymouri TaxID=5684 RepID=A0A0N0P3R5_LEPSE|nr:hypothetical protein ABL78_6518 [Leptomonas seymouri]|eukprot:KPI84436.1 hypothetical protein ABL78_6518 [Leptomonas seymouri]